MHPAQLHAHTALWSTRAALRHLEAAHAGDGYTTPRLAPAEPRPRTARQLAELDRTIAAERPDRVHLTGAHLTPAAGPVDPATLDLDREVRTTLGEVHALVAYVHRSHPLLAWSGHWPAVAAYLGARRRDPRWSWLAAALPAAPPAVAAQAGRLLTELDARIRRTLGIDPDEQPVPGAPPCPVCGQRRLRYQCSAPTPVRWTVVCRAAGCPPCRGPGDPAAGDGCPCGMPERAPGAVHIWTPAEAAAATARPAARELARAA